MTTDSPTIQKDGYLAHGVLATPLNDNPSFVTVDLEPDDATKANAGDMRVKPEEKIIPSQRVSVKITLLI